MLHARSEISMRCDEPSLVGCAGLVPVMALAACCGLAGLVSGLLGVPVSAGANAAVKVQAIVAGMVAGADCIDDLDLRRHGVTDRLFGGVRAPSTWGTFLRALTWGHVRQLEAVARRLLVALPRHALVLADVGVYALVDADSTIRRTFGYAKQGASFGYTKVKGLHPLLAVLATPTAAPLVVASRLREGRAASARGAACFVAEALAAARQAGATGLVLFRADSALLLRRGPRRLPPRRRPLLGHGTDDRLGAGRHRRHRRDGLAADQVSAGGVGRRRRPVGFRR